MPIILKLQKYSLGNMKALKKSITVLKEFPSPRKGWGSELEYGPNWTTFPLVKNIYIVKTISFLKLPADKKKISLPYSIFYKLRAYFLANISIYSK